LKVRFQSNSLLVLLHHQIFTLSGDENYTEHHDCQFQQTPDCLVTLVLATFVGGTSAATVKYAGTFGDYFGDAYQGANDVLNDTERHWLNNGKILLILNPVPQLFEY
jgi:hypothetical protein